MSSATVSKWRQRFLQHEMVGVYLMNCVLGDRAAFSDERVAEVVRKTLETKPKEGTR